MNDKFGHILDFLIKNKEWIFSGIGISVIGLIFCFFKKKPSEAYQKIESGNSNQLISGEKNQIQKSDQNSINYQSAGDINITNGIPIDQMSKLVTETVKIICSELPVVAQQAQNNAIQYSNELTAKLKPHLTNDELKNLLDPDFVAVLMQSMREASRTDEAEVHQVLSEAVVQRMKIGKTDLKRLAFNQAVEITLKLDSNLLRILSALFFITHLKQNGYHTLEEFIKFNRSFFVHVSDVKISSSSVTYLQAVGCGSVQSFSKIRIGEIFLEEYKFLFYKDIPLNELNDLKICDSFKTLMFSKINGKNVIDSGCLYVLQNGWTGINIHGSNCHNTKRLIDSISNEEKNIILSLVSRFRLNTDEVEGLFMDKVPECQSFMDQLKKNHHLFKLTPVGSAIALSFWKSKGKELDVNIWIN